MEKITIVNNFKIKKVINRNYRFFIISIIMVMLGGICSLFLKQEKVSSFFEESSIIGVFFDIIINNFRLMIIILIFSVIPYIVSTVLCGMSLFIFGVSFGMKSLSSGFIDAFFTYPHAILEIIGISVIWSISYRISSSVINSVKLNKFKGIEIDILKTDFIIAVIMLILASLLEVVSILV